MGLERERMLAGALYDPTDPELDRQRRRAQRLCQRLREHPADDHEGIALLVAELIGAPTDAFVTPPFFCDYGPHIALGREVYFNANCVVLDVCRVSIGDRTLFGPSVQVYTASHPMAPEERAAGLEFGKPVTIGADVWIGGGAIVCPGVTIGDGAVVGAGSVVTRDVPARVFVAGNPARVVRHIENAACPAHTAGAGRCEPAAASPTPPQETP